MNYVVYKHTCPNGRAYIGITKQNLERRWRSGTHYDYNRRFFLEIVKYGWDNFKHEVLERGLSYEAAKQKETEYIEKFKTADERFGYNQTLGVGGKGFRMSLEAREKIRKANTGRKHTPEEIEKMRQIQKGRWLGGKSPSAKKVYQYDLEGNFIKEWDSQSDAARFYHCCQTKISECTRGKKKQIKGFVWRSEKV